MSRITPLPADWTTWDLARKRAARQERDARASALTADLNAMSRDDTAELRTINDDLEAMSQVSAGALRHVTPRAAGPSAPQRHGRGPSPWAGAIDMGALGMRALDPSGALQLGSAVRREPVGLGQQNLSLLDIIPMAPPLVGTDSFQYLRQTTRTNNAAAVARYGIKPESVIDLVKVSDTVQTIATISEPIPRDYLSDVERLATFIEGEFVFMVREEVEQQFLVGNGTAPNLSGILDQSGLQTQAKGADPVPDAVLKAMTKVRVNARREPTHVVMHPNDWEDVALLRTADGSYVFGAPGADTPKRMWNLPVILTTGITQNTALVGDFTGSITGFEAEGVRVDWHDGVPVTIAAVDTDAFRTNTMVLRAETRVGLAVLMPASFCSVTSI
jgi:HK97 family phage major capsid protein